MRQIKEMYMKLFVGKETIHALVIFLERSILMLYMSTEQAPPFPPEAFIGLQIYLLHCCNMTE